MSPANAHLTPPPGPITSVRFERNDPTRLYIGTLAGVYGCDNLPAHGAALPGPNFRWRTYNAGLPVGLVESLDITLSNTLRCATYGHGMWEMKLNATASSVIPAVKLVLRNHIADDARVYPAANRFVTTLVLHQAQYQIIYTHLILELTHQGMIGGLYLLLASNLMPRSLKKYWSLSRQFVETENIVYVHVQNRGHTTATNVEVHLYWAEATTT